MKIDVVMITKNSLKPCLQECLNAILQNIPVASLIIVDSESQDGTLEVIKNRIKKSKAKFTLIQRNVKRGKARELGIRKVSTDWFAFIDSDVILTKNWFTEISVNT